MSLRTTPALLLTVALAGCATVPQTSTPIPQRPDVSTPPTEPVPPPPAALRNPEIMSLPGLEGVIGASANSLISQFGDPRLDVKEGDVRKLQFSGTACVLDVYLYPLARNAEPTATYVDARRASDGLDVDRAACVRALRR